MCKLVFVISLNNILQRVFRKFLLGAECNEASSYLKGRFLQGTVGSCSRFQYVLYH